MKYYICEGSTAEGKYNATSKARADAENILNRNGYKPYSIHTTNCVKKNKLLKILQFFGYIKNYIIWKKEIKKIPNYSIVVIQYPIIYTALFFKSILKKLNKMNITTIALIHDLDSIRLKETDGLRFKRAKYEDMELPREFSYVISHNEKMTQKLLEFGVKKNKIINLNLFDYLSDVKIEINKRGKDKPIIIAGNLSTEKAGFLKELNKIKKIKFNLYGKGLDIELNKNINYKGSFLPDELSENLEGSFGLVWDGTSIYKINGTYGNYMKYNNPHKISLYISSELPVIVSSESALAPFVTKNKIGITVKSLKELENVIPKITEKEYNEMLNNIKKISIKIKIGDYLTEAINKIK